MKVHEYQAKELFAAYGIPVKSHRLCQTAHEAVEAYRSMGAEEVVLKAQVLTGGRGKAGGIKLANTAEEVENKARQILGMTIKDYPVQKIFCFVKRKIFLPNFMSALSLTAIKNPLCLS